MGEGAMNRTITLTPISATGWTNSERAILEPRTGTANSALAWVGGGATSPELLITFSAEAGQADAICEKATLLIIVANGTPGAFETIELAGVPLVTPGDPMPGTEASFTYETTALFGHTVESIAEAGLRFVSANTGSKLRTHNVIFVDVTLECRDLGGNPQFTKTLGDIKAEITQTIGRAPSEMAVIAAQTEIAEALEIQLAPMADGDTNRVLTSFPALYAYCILAHHAALIRDEQAAAIWRGTYEVQKRMARASLLAASEAQRVLPRPRAPGATP